MKRLTVNELDANYEKQISLEDCPWGLGNPTSPGSNHQFHFELDLVASGEFNALNAEAVTQIQ